MCLAIYCGQHALCLTRYYKETCLAIYCRQHALCLVKYYNEACVLLSTVDNMLYALLSSIMRHMFCYLL